MKPSLNVALVQCQINWQSPEENRKALAKRLAPLVNTDVDIVVLPEVFTTGFIIDDADSNDASSSKASSEKVLSLAEPLLGETLSWMTEQAQQLNACLTGSVIIEDNGDKFNRLYWVAPDGAVEQYDKRFLFRMGGEHQRYSAGSDRLIVEYQGWRINPLICYDLRFPEGCRNYYSEDSQALDFDLQIFVANWPEARRDHWRSLLKARAIENLCCLVGVNRVGSDIKGWQYSGDSLALSAKGELLLDCQAREGVFVSEFNAHELVCYRESFPAYLDAWPRPNSSKAPGV